MSDPVSPNAGQPAKKPVQNLKPLAHGDASTEAVGEGSDFLRRRQDWFFKPRAFPLGFIPQGARERALQHKIQMYQREGRLSLLEIQPGNAFLTPPSGPTSAWFSVGPQPTRSLSFPPFTSGRVSALAANPNNASNLYLGSADGGLWVTTDGGNTWSSLTDTPPNAANIPTVAVGALAVDPTTCGTAPSGICTTVYVGTGEDNFGVDNIYGEGVLNCAVTAGAPPTAACTQDTTFHTPSPLDPTRGGPLVGALAVNRAAGRNNILLAGVRGRGSAIPSGVWCSSDKGATWVRVLPTALTNGAGDPGTDVAFASDGTAWAALGFVVPTAANGIYKSTAPVTSCAISWNQQTLPAAFTASNIGRITLALAPSSDATLYAAVADASTTSANLLGVVRSTNANTATPTWTQLTDPLVSAAQGFCTGQCFYDLALSVHPKNPAVVYGGGSGKNPIIRTTTGTTTALFADVTAAGGTVPHVDTHAFAFAGDGSKLYVGNDGGVWSTTAPDATLSWSNLNAPTSGSSAGSLNITQFYPGISIHPSNPGFALGGTQDNGIQIDQTSLAPPFPLIWQDAGLPCDGGFTAIDSQIPSTTYGECEYVPPSILFIAVAFGGDGMIGNGFLATSGIDGTDRGAFIPPLVIDQRNTQTLYFGTCRVWQTKDGANTWNAISPDVTTASHPATCPEPSTATAPSATVSTIAVAPSDSNTIYTGSDQGEVEVTSNAGSAWTSITTSTLPTRAVTQIVVDPASPGTAFAAFSGFGSCNNSAVVCDGKGHVFKTGNGTSGAATWVDISGITTKLPDIPVNTIVLDPADAAHNTLYVGTDIGAFFTTDGGVNWSPLGASGSIPNAQILSLALHNPSRTLRAATHGRGVWDINLGGQAAFGITSIAPLMATAPAPDTTLTVNGNGFTATSKIQFGSGITLIPTSTSATQLTATIPAANLAAGAAVPVSVTDPAQVNPTNALPFTILNPVPGITTISPTSTTAGTKGFTLTVNGSNFICGGANATIVLFNSVPRTNIVPGSCTASQLQVALPDTDLAAGQIATIDTFTPQPGGGPDSNPAPPTLTINNLAPTLTSISPTTAAAGGPAFTLTLTGSNFNASSVVNFNGNAKITTFNPAIPTQLTASIAVSDIATAGTKPVTVNNPAPGGGTTAAQNFTVTGSGPDFTITAAAPTSVSVNSGASATYTVAVAGTNGFSASVNVSCALSAAATTCAANPASLAPGSNTTITVTTTAHQLLPPVTSPRRFAPWHVIPLSLLLVLALTLFLFGARTRHQRLAISVPLVGIVFFLALQGVGCSGGGNGPSQHGTQAGSYTVTITGTSGSATHTATVTVVVN